MKAYFYAVLMACILSSCVLEGGVPGEAGGYVFYDKGRYSDGWRYMECAPENVGEGMSQSEAEVLCEYYSYGGYDDWCLPSIQELVYMYTNLHKKGMGNFDSVSDSTYYWASDEKYGFSFKNGSASSLSSSAYVRPVRKF